MQNDDLQDAYLDFVTIAKDILIGSVYTLECDGIQPHYLGDFLNDEDILPFLLTFTNFQQENNLHVYPLVPKNWYHGSRNLIDIADTD